MAVEVGQIVQGTVVRLLNYGVLVRLDDNSTGLVHISEIDNNFVRDVNDYFGLQDQVMVKVLAAGERGKIELSVKQAKAAGAESPTPRPRTEEVPAANGSGGSVGGHGGYPREGGHSRGDGDGGYGGRRESRGSFEDKMGDFMRSSSERLSDLKRNIENKRGGKKTR